VPSKDGKSQYCDHLQAVKFFLLDALKQASNKLNQDMEKMR
jgi:hypothetical protein